MTETININGQTISRDALDFEALRPLIAQATENAVRKAILSDGDFELILMQADYDISKLAMEVTDRLHGVREYCFGDIGHQWSEEAPHCARCGLDAHDAKRIHPTGYWGPVAKEAAPR